MIWLGALTVGRLPAFGRRGSYPAAMGCADWQGACCPRNDANFFKTACHARDAYQRGVSGCRLSVLLRTLTDLSDHGEKTPKKPMDFSTALAGASQYTERRLVGV